MVKPLRSNTLVRFTHLLAAFALFLLPVQQTKTESNYLRTSGNQILDVSGKVVGLGGVNWFGFETETRAPHGLERRNWEEMLDQIRELGYNVIRLPFSNAMLAPGAKPVGINYAENPDLRGLTALEVMDQIIAGAGERDIRIILDNHRSTAGGGPESNGLWYTSNFPETRWIDDWEMLAERYKGNDTVIGMDLRNEPFGACWGCGDSARDWRLAAEKAGNAILSVNPNLLIIVEGIANYHGQYTWWGGNLMGARDFPIRLKVENRLVYSAHEYPASIYPQPWFSNRNYPDNLPSIWEKYWGYLADDFPILIGEFGTRLGTESDRQWFEKFTEYIDSKGLHWTFWSLNPNSGDTGGLLLDNWTSVHQEKHDVLKEIQYPFVESNSSSTPREPSPDPAPRVNTSPPSSSASKLTVLLDNFESASLQTWHPFQSANSRAAGSIVSPGQAGDHAMKLEYAIREGGWCGIERDFPTSQDWTLYGRIQFGFYGTDSGATIRFEIFDNRGQGSGDTAERFEFKFVDNFTGWKVFALPLSAFVRRADWQPPGAPNDGFGREEVWGFNISPLNGQGSFQIDEIKLMSP